MTRMTPGGGIGTAVPDPLLAASLSTAYV